MTEEYNPLDHSIVQAISGAFSQFECDDFVEALIDSILDEIKRVHWNLYQHQWGPTWNDDEIESPEIEGIGFVRFYSERCDCGGREHETRGCLPECVGRRPNFSFEDVEIRWYKYPGRGMSTNKDWKPDEWKAWFDRCLAKVRQFDTHSLDYRKSKEDRDALIALDNLRRKAFYEKYKDTGLVRDTSR